MKQALHFTIGEGMHLLTRQAYWFENRKDWANRFMDDLCMGITEEQKIDVFEGNAIIIPIEGGDRVSLKYKEDLEFKKELAEWKERNLRKIGNHVVLRSLIEDYISHLNLHAKEDRIEDLEWFERTRSELHNKIFNSISLDRFDGEGQKFSKRLDKYCEEMLADPMDKALKRLSIAETDADRRMAELDMRNAMMFKSFQNIRNR